MKQTHKRVGVVLEEGAPYSRRLLEGVFNYAAQHPGFHLEELDYKCGHAPRWLDQPLTFDGMVWWVGPGELWAEQVLLAGIPVVNTCGGWHQRIPVVAFSIQDIQKTALDYLGHIGRNTVGIMLHNLQDDPEFIKLRDEFTTQAAARGYQPFSFDAGRQPGITHNPPQLSKRTRHRLQHFLRKLPLPAALWAQDDFIAHATLEAAGLLGLDVPGQLAVLGLGDYPVARCSHPQLSTIPQPGELIGFEAMRVLDRMISGHPPEHMTILIPPPPVVARGSTPVAGKAVDLMLLAHDFIARNAHKGITVKDVLRLTDMSLPTLYKRYEAVYGQTPGEAIRAIKLERVRHHLLTTTLGISQVAELCGFSHPSKFANFFRRNTGLSPRAFRQQHATAQSTGSTATEPHTPDHPV